MRTKGILFSVLGLAIAGSAALVVSSALMDQSARFAPRSGADGLNQAAYDQSYQGSVQWFFNLRKDANTNTLNYANMVQASIDANRPAGNSIFTAPLNLQWSEMGPSNVGGRTRALLIDRNNPAKIYAGGVAGGLWISENGGTNWAIYKDTMVNMCVSSITQGADGDIYFGTGEGLYYLMGTGAGGMVGSGVWKSTDNGATFNRIVSATTPNNPNIVWAAVNDMAASPTLADRIYAGTSEGLMITSDGGATWTAGITSPANGEVTDVAVSTSGQVIVSYAGKVYLSPNGDPGTFTSISTGGNQLPSVTHSRTTLAYSPDDPNYVYACVVKTSGLLHGVYVSKDAGTTWYLIGPGGSSSTFQPFGGSQGRYDCAIAVYPGNKNKIVLGGVELWTYEETLSNPPYGGQWNLADSQIESPFNPWYVHADKHEIVFRPGNGNIFYIGCDGGVFRTMDGGLTFQPMNNGYNVTQFYSVAMSKSGNEYMGGTQDNGTQYVDHTGNNYFSADEVSGGDGAYSEISFVNPAAMFSGSYYGAVYRSSNYGQSMGTFYNARVGGNAALGTPPFASFVTPFVLYENLNDPNAVDSITFVNAPMSFVVGSADGINAQYNTTLPFPQASAEIVPNSVTITVGSQTVTDNGSGGLVGSINTSGVNTINYITGACTVTFASVPSANAVINVDYSLRYTNGDLLVLNSNSANFPVNHIVSGTINPGDTLRILDPVVSKLAVGFTGACYLIRHPLNFATSPEWIKIGGGQSRTLQGNILSPAFGGEIQTMCWSNTGDHLYVGTSSGHVYRIDNLNTVVDSAGNADVDSASGGNTDCIVRTTRLGHFSNTAITGLGVDPNNNDRLVVTTGGYTGGTHVYICDTARIAVISTGSSNPTKFASRQGNLPAMPVYDVVVDMVNANAAIIATEFGTWTTNNISASSPTWTKEINGMANVPTLMIRQQTARNWVVSNTGQLWVGTHGRGIYSSNTLLQPMSVEPSPFGGNAVNVFKSSVKVFPNPMSEQGQVSFFMPGSGEAHIEVYNLSGKRVKLIELGKMSAGSYIQDLDVSDLARGTYFVAVVANGQKAVAKFVKAN
ncbi:MAG: T9SS type A sorting domain-containing protein [Bacteroidia bacterium]|nr:T9SS type A sorting domain-containing protein [Bacteroidia bacterium]